MDEIVNVVKEYFIPMLTEPFLLIRSGEILRRRQEALKKSIELVEEAYQRYWWRSRSNNWLKLHGYPMRRKWKRH